MNLKISCAVLSDKGRVRPSNEDSFAVDSDKGIYLVADGMGGEKAGEVASNIVAQVLPKQLSKDLDGFGDPSANDFIAKVEADIAVLSMAVRDASAGKPNLQGMGSTLVAALIRGDKALIANVGDSRAYLLRDGALQQVTKDHSVVQLLLDSGSISEAEADNHPFRGQLLKCMGMNGVAQADCFLVYLQPKDKILLCSDGLTDMLDDKMILSTLLAARVPKSACQKLVDAANEEGGHDNITAMVIAVSSGATPSGKKSGTSK